MFQTLIPNPELLCIVCYFLSKGEPCRHLIGQLHGSSETGQPPLPAAPIVIQPPKPKKNLWSITTALKSHYRYYFPNYVVFIEMMSDYRKLEPCLNTVVNVVILRNANLQRTFFRLVRADHGPWDDVTTFFAEEEAPPEAGHVKNECQKSCQARYGWQSKNSPVLFQTGQGSRRCR